MVYPNSCLVDFRCHDQKVQFNTTKTASPASSSSAPAISESYQCLCVALVSLKSNILFQKITCKQKEKNKKNILEFREVLCCFGSFFFFGFAFAFLLFLFLLALTALSRSPLGPLGRVGRVGLGRLGRLRLGLGLGLRSGLQLSKYVVQLCRNTT